jgi:PIN domain nuclease of toxin-antitoxin system
VKLLLDTHLLLGAAEDDPALPQEARVAIEDTGNTVYFSVASIWEIVIKNGLGRDDFKVDARVLRRNLLDAGFEELAIEATHILEVAQLPSLHKDPFDRVLIGQAMAEGIVLLTHDHLIKQYDLAPIRFV